jgi:CBS domain-containing protein
MFVQDVMTREPTTVTPNTTIKRAAEILVERQISSLPVLDDRGRVCGVLSEADLIRDAFVPDARGHMLPGEYGERLTPTLVEDVMTQHAIHRTRVKRHRRCCRPDDFERGQVLACHRRRQASRWGR